MTTELEPVKCVYERDKMTDRQFVKRCLKISEKWGKIGRGDIDLRLPDDAARLCAEWLADQLLNRKCLISRHYSDNRITLGDCSLEFSNTDYRTALLSAAQKLIEEGK